LLGAAAALHVLSRGDLCYALGEPLVDESDDALEDAPVDGAWPEREAWRRALRDSSAVEVVGAEPHAERPLVLDSLGHLYLRRTFAQQQQVAQSLTQRAEALLEVDDDALRADLEWLFPKAGADDLQRKAVALAARRRLSVITGGPGTGKTTTVAKVLALLIAQALRRDEAPPRIALTAPTGKAAARMAEALSRTSKQIELSAAARAAMPDGASTMHRLLGLAPGMRRRLPDARLPWDVVIVDEASMVDLGLMAEFLRALPLRTRLVLLGDADQLASVAEGAVFADVCAAPDGSPLAEARVRLVVGHRYSADSAVGQLAERVRVGDVPETLAILSDKARDAVTLHDGLATRGLDLPFFDLACAHYAPFLAATGPAARLRAFDSFRVLTAHRRGPYGAPAIAARVREALIERGLLRRFGHQAVTLEPVLIVRNAPALGLFNGDVGYVERLPGEEARAHFLSQAGAVRTFSPSRLPAHESAWAMTVHKSQGSELDHVALILPKVASPVCTRELVYTAITRARSDVDIYAPSAVLEAAIARSTSRRGGLRHALAGLAEPVP